MSSSHKPAGKKVAVWAINPFEVETRPGSAVQEELKKWASANDTELQPVHVFYVPSADVPAADRGAWVKRYIPALEKEVTSYLSTLSLPAMRAPKVLIQHGGSTHEAVETLIQYAEDLGATWTLSSSKGRSGIRRLALGSFAETLLLKSTVPVWLFGHGDPKVLDPTRILFSTDFSEVSKNAYESVVAQASKLGANVTLFHCVNLPNEMLTGLGAMGAAGVFPADDYIKSQTAWAKETADRWVWDAQLKGVKVKLVIKEIAPSIATAVLNAATEEKAGIIALASRSGPVAAVLLGSHARQIVRQAECPVWVFGPKVPGTAKDLHDARALSTG